MVACRANTPASFSSAKSSMNSESTSSSCCGSSSSPCTSCINHRCVPERTSAILTPKSWAGSLASLRHPSLALGFALLLSPLGEQGSSAPLGGNSQDACRGIIRASASTKPRWSLRCEPAKALPFEGGGPTDPWASSYPARTGMGRVPLAASAHRHPRARQTAGKRPQYPFPPEPVAWRPRGAIPGSFSTSERWAGLAVCALFGSQSAGARLGGATCRSPIGDLGR